jgi:hypothetical protein
VQNKEEINMNSVLNSFVILIIIYAGSLSAEENKTVSNNSGNASSFGSFTPQSKYNQSATKFLPQCSGIDDKEIKIACKKAFLKKFSTFEFELAHKENVLRWQHLSTQIILFVVLVLVGLGLYFAWVQFHADNTNKKIRQEISEVEISMSGIKISSPVLGVIILTLSLAFFYLYLVYVYPITILPNLS